MCGNTDNSLIPLDRLRHRQVVQFVSEEDRADCGLRMNDELRTQILHRQAHIIKCTTLGGVDQVPVLRIGDVSDSLPIIGGVAPQGIAQSKGTVNFPNTIVDISIRWLFDDLVRKATGHGKQYLPSSRSV